MNRSVQSGVTLIELMVAMTISLLLIGAIGSVYVANKETYRTSDTVARLQENARFALRAVTENIQMAGFLGNSSNPLLVDRRLGTTGQLGTAINDCAPRWYIDMSSLLLVGNNGAPSVGGTAFETMCLAGKHLLTGTDVVALKRAAVGDIDDATSSAHVNWTLLRTDPMRGEFFLGGSPIPTGFTAAVSTERRWLAHVYFIAQEDDDAPGLNWLALGSGPELYNKGELVPGIQDLQIQLGVDTNGDGNANQFVEPNVPITPEVVAARVWVLARSETPEIDHDDSINTYTYANKRYTPGDDATDNDTETADDPTRYRRLLISSTVTLRNRR